MNNPTSTLGVKSNITLEGENARLKEMDKLKVLIVDNDPAICNYFTQLLAKHGYETVSVENCQNDKSDLIIMDLSMSVMGGCCAGTQR